MCLVNGLTVTKRLIDGTQVWNLQPSARRIGPCNAHPGDYLPHVRFAAVFAKGEPANNGDNRIRTGDPLLAKQVLYQLSYTPMLTQSIFEKILSLRSWCVFKGEPVPL